MCVLDLPPSRSYFTSLLHERNHDDIQITSKTSIQKRTVRRNKPGWTRMSQVDFPLLYSVCKLP